MFFLLPDNIQSFPLNSWIYTVPYYFLVFYIFINAKKYNILCDTKNMYGVSGYDFDNHQYTKLLMVICLFFGLRWHLFSDSMAYKEAFDSFKPIFTWSYLEENSWWWEKGYLLFALVFKLFSDDFSLFMFINSCIDFTLFYFVIKRYSVNIPLTLLLFLAFYGILMECNMMRNMKAILMFLISFRYIESRECFKYMACNIVGIAMHSSAYLFLPMYWLLNYRYRLNFLYVICAIFTIIYLFQVDVVSELIIYALDRMGSADALVVSKFAHYFEGSAEQVLSVGTAERILTLCLALLAYKTELSNNRRFVLFFNSYLFFYIFYAIFGFNEVFRDRFTTLFYYSYWFIYPYLLVFFSKKTRVFQIGLYCFIMLKIFIFTSKCAAYYETSLFHDTTIAEREYLNEMTSETSSLTKVK